jgi:hypothetical protein
LVCLLGVPRLYDQRDLRLSYVIWQEGVRPAVVVELLSPGTADEDLGRIQRQPDQPPTQWEVYEQILAVPYYVVFDRYTDQLRAFTLVSGRYQEISITNAKVWMPTLKIGLGLWQGTYLGCDRLWLRWYDTKGDWLPTEVEIEQQQVTQTQQHLASERQRAEAAEARAAALAERLRELGVDPDQ